MFGGTVVKSSGSAERQCFKRLEIFKSCLLFVELLRWRMNCPLSYYIKQKYFLLTALVRVIKLHLGNTEKRLETVIQYTVIRVMVTQAACNSDIIIIFAAHDSHHPENQKSDQMHVFFLFGAAKEEHIDAYFYIILCCRMIVNKQCATLRTQ